MISYISVLQYVAWNWNFSRKLKQVSLVKRSACAKNNGYCCSVYNVLVWLECEQKWCLVCGHRFSIHHYFRWILLSQREYETGD